MLNLSNVPNAQISGLSDEELSWVTSESNSRFVVELDAKLFEELGAVDLKDMEFNDLEPDIIKEMDEAEEANIPESTKFSTSQHVSKFKSFLSAKGLSENIETMPATFLNSYLRLFYYSLGCKDGRPYAPRSLIGIRAAIQRFFNSPKVNRKINIISDQEFVRANSMLKTMIGKWLREGKKSKP